MKRVGKHLPVEQLIQVYDVFSRLCLSTLIGVAAVSKMRSAGWLAHRQTLWRALPPLRRYVTLIAAGSVIAEVLCAVLLLVLPAGGYSYLASLLLLAAFSIFTLLKIRRGDTELCRCFGATDRTTPKNALARNVVALLIGSLGAVAATDQQTLNQVSLLGAAASGVFAGVLLVTIPGLVSMRPRRTTL